MTVTTLLAEICSRCGEGYENWTTRAGQYFKMAVEELIRSGNYSAADYHGLVRTSTYLVGGSSITTLALSTMLTAGYELIEILDINYNIGSAPAVNWIVDVVSYPEKLATDLNPELLTTGRKLWYWTTGSTPGFTFSSIAAATTINYTIVFWKDDPLLTGATVISDYFVETMLQDIINFAAKKMYSELKA